MSAPDLTGVNEAYKLLVDDVAHSISPDFGIDALRKALDELEAAEQTAAHQKVLDAIAAAVGNATTHEWAALNRIARCDRCRTMASRSSITNGSVPVCAPGQGCQHAIVPDAGGASHCSNCKTVYPSTVEAAVSS
jgi:hypothetical protein